MARKKARAKAAKPRKRKTAPKPRWGPGYVFVYPAEKGHLQFSPGDIVEVKEEEFAAWQATLEKGHARKVESLKAGMELAASIVEGTFILSPQVSQTPHSIQHGSVGEGKPVEGDLSL